MNEEDVLAYNSFEGDFGSPADRLLRDKMVTVRVPGPCHNCGQQLEAGERARSRSEVVDGEIMRWRWCQSCCEAMALSWQDAGEAIEARFAMRSR